jgi:hypothetical protein
MSMKLFAFQGHWPTPIAIATALSLSIAGPAVADSHSTYRSAENYYLVQPQAKDFAAPRGKPDVSSESARVIDELYQELTNPSAPNQPSPRERPNR